LTSHKFVALLPILGEVPISSALFFDLGVLAIVLGATVLILIALAHQSIRTHRKPKTTVIATEGAE
jgi:multicomponent K+:H+ antiporter subunit A